MRLLHPFARVFSSLFLAVNLLTPSILLRAGDTKPLILPYEPHIDPASDKAEKAISKFQLAPGMKAELFAAEPMLANPVCFTIDHQGRFYVGETFRLHSGVTDMRNHMSWLADDQACRTIGDRLASMKKNLHWETLTYAVHHDRIRELLDTDGDGRADKSIVFADGFNHALDGIGAGLLEDRGSVYWTCIPDLWKLTDTNGDGVADERESLSTGYGVHIGFLGHDLHGLRKGPDGRIYFSIGDRGFNVVNKEGKRLFSPDRGAVLRCNPDGSELEVYHTGLRNPQELVFDDYGNLFTGDNNSDGGDKARWVQVIEGGDSGWTYGFQWFAKPYARGAWNLEKMWYPQWKGQAAFLVPPLANIGAGPSGVAYYPGTGMPDKYKGHFFMCDFRGTSFGSIIHTFKLNPKGASFEVADLENFTKGALATDCDFGLEGGLYFSDWTEGWEKPGKGRIYRVFDPTLKGDPATAETKKLLMEGMEKKSEWQLAELLMHNDQRVRLEAQYELVDRALKAAQRIYEINDPEQIQNRELAVDLLTEIAIADKKYAEGYKIEANDERADRFQRLLIRTSANDLARLHAIWGVGQYLRLGRKQGLLKDGASKRFVGFYEYPWGSLYAGLGDSDPEIRAQAVKTLEELYPEAKLNWPKAVVQDFIKADHEQFLPLLHDPSPRVRFFTAVTLGNIASDWDEDIINPLLQMLRENNDEDPYLRHAGVMGLAGVGDAEKLLAHANDESSAVRMGILLALRRLGSPEIARFLRDKDPLLVAEAARAINDLPIEAAMPQLASLASETSNLVAMSELGADTNPIILRALNANFRLGKSDNAAAIANLAAAPGMTEMARLEALWELRDWAEPAGTDRVYGVWRPLPKRDKAVAGAAIASKIAPILSGSSDKIREAAAQLAGQYHAAEAAPALLERVADANEDAKVRVASLHALGEMAAPELKRAISIARADSRTELRTEGTTWFAKLNPAEAVKVLGEALDHGSAVEKQGAVVTLASLTDPQAVALLGDWMEKLLAGNAPAEIHLELLDAAQKQADDGIKAKLEKYKAAISKEDTIGEFRECLSGGNAKNGETIFFTQVEAQCQKCHTVSGKGGGEVGPELTGIGGKKDRLYLLESIVKPNATIAEGFENVTLTLNDGSELAGRVTSEDENEIHLDIPVQEEGEEFIEPDEAAAKGAEKGDAEQAKQAKSQPEKSGDGEKKKEIKEIQIPQKFIQQTVKKSDVKSRVRNLSSMPDDVSEPLTKAELRDLVEFLASLK